ncbi:MAG: thioesterase [Bacteroidetes bacterium]|nr:thioesterase [Bacteroidota bacterium]
MWSMIDANMHLRHSAYADFAAQARLQVLESLGFDSAEMEKLRVGPILFREELLYYREIRPNDTVRVTCQLSKCRKDGSRWSFLQEIYRSDEVKACEIHVDGAWVDLDKRKLASLDAMWSERFLEMPKTPDFILEPIPEKR